MEELLRRGLDGMAAADEEGVSTKMWGTLQSLKAEGTLSNNGNARWARTVLQRFKGKEVLSIWTAHLFRLMEKHTKNFSGGLALNELKADPGYVDSAPIKLGGEQRKCMRFDVKTTRLPGWVLDQGRQVDSQGDENQDD